MEPSRYGGFNKSSSGYTPNRADHPTQRGKLGALLADTPLISKANPLRQARDFLSVLAAGNPFPIAVGEMTMDREEITEMKGRAMRLVHAYGDELWASGDKRVPNAGFISQEVTAYDASLEPEPEELMGSDGEEVEDDTDGADGKKKKEKKEKKAKKEDESEEERKRRKKKEKKEKRERKEAKLSEDAGGGLTIADMDAALEYCFCAAVTKTDGAQISVRTVDLRAPHAGNIACTGTGHRTNSRIHTRACAPESPFLIRNT